MNNIALSNKNYYITKKRWMLKGFKKRLKKMEKIIDKNFPTYMVPNFINNAISCFENIIPEIPYIGGAKNPDTMILIGSVEFLSLIKILDADKIAEDKIGSFLLEIAVIYGQALVPFPFLLKLFVFNKKRLVRVKKRAELSKLKKYEYGWVADYVDGDKINFDFGINYLECGICKFYKKMGYEKYVKYVCEMDYPMYNYMGLGFFRTKTIANGAKLCDFRFSRVK